MSDLASDLTDFYGPNAGYVLELYDRYQADPNSVDDETRNLFANWKPVLPSSAPIAVSPAVHTPTETFDVGKVVAAARIARLVRELGHLTAHTDPLGSEPPGDPGLELPANGLETSDLTALPASVIGGPLSERAANALEALGNLRRAYSGSIGYEDDHIQIAVERHWLREAAETHRFFEGFDAVQKREVLERLTEVESFENFLQQTFGPEKRFSIEGTDMLVPMLDEIIREASEAGTREVVMGMAHRGRLNVLAHILGKPYAAILAEFQAAHADDNASVAGTGSLGYTGDVKYHQGARRKYSGHGASREMPITLAPNPSHLEFVDPVVEGRARAAQEDRRNPGPPLRDSHASLAILIHGDAAFPGQGVVAETLNLEQLPGYTVGGTIHIISNNQIGFTTDTTDSRSTLYASDLAKGFEIPIVHVNADDPEACIAAARMAHAYRERFGKDFLIDLVGYRRYGHNEADEPAFTQPRMYEIIRAHLTVRALWAAELERQGVIARDEAEAMTTTTMARLQEARQQTTQPQPAKNEVDTRPPTPPAAPAQTAISESEATALNEALLTFPAGFTVNGKLEQRELARRRTAFGQENSIVWGHAEALAFASILADGIPIRLSGQDTERGTFTQRHAVLHDPTTGAVYTPLQHLPQAQASFGIYNSPLSETAALGFEYGYNAHAAKTLVLWEAQFGDFSNGAQVIVDQFIVSGRTKWQQSPSLVLLLPHGYEGQGPEHSSARLERYLQLAATDNIRIANCTTSAQYFHILRRQALLLETAPRPLVIMTPKVLLRHPLASSSLSDLTQGSFQPVLADPISAPSSVTRLILCSGKVYVDLAASPDFKNEHIAVGRVEQLYPFPETEMQNLLAQLPALQEVIWLQEEPQNMGAWTYIAPRLRALLGDLPLTYVGRPESASPSEGSSRQHKWEQARIVKQALTNLPEEKLEEKKSRRNGKSNGKSHSVNEAEMTVTKTTSLE